MKNSSAIDVSISIKLMDDSAECIWFDPNDREEYENSVIYDLHLICVEKSECSK